MPWKNAQVGAGVDEIGVLGEWIKYEEAAGGGGTGSSRYYYLPWKFDALPALPFSAMNWL